MYTRKFFDQWRKCESKEFTKRLAFFCAVRSGPFSNELCNFVANDLIEEICTFNIDYNSSASLIEFRYARQCIALFSKDADLSIRDGEQAMVDGFIKSEERNRLVNKAYYQGLQSGIIDAAEDGLLLSIARKISEILGDLPNFADLEFAFGPGSSTNVKLKTSARHKLQATPAFSADIVNVLQDFTCEVPHLVNYHKNYNIEVATLSSVPKNWKTRRSILVEPNMMTFFQKGFGSYIKQRLLLFGCNLYTQENNQRLALQGSIDDKLATVDLENASNSMSTLPIYYLLQFSPEWFDILNQVRTSQYTYKSDKVKTLEMFSSMGNGFTFELESLVFYATALVVCDRLGLGTSNISVFGDDIILPSTGVELLSKALNLLGFCINHEKSYVQGPFRESCGKDYLLGNNIRPFYKKDRWTWARVVGLLNYDYRNFDLFYDIRDHIISSIPKDLINFGPDGFGDGHIVVPDYSFYGKRSKRNPRQEYRQGTLDGFFYTTITKIQLRDNEEIDYSNSETYVSDTKKSVDIMNSNLLPLYSIYSRPSLRFAKWVEVYNQYGVLVRYLNIGKNTDCVSTRSYIDQIKDLSSLQFDPYSLQGGWKEKETKIYVLN